MNTINGLLAGSSPMKVLSEQSAKLAGKWDRSGLLEGIESSTEKNNMAMLLENQAKQLVNEANTTGTDASFSSGNSEAWAGVALPLVRRVFGEIVAKATKTTPKKSIRENLGMASKAAGTSTAPKKPVLNESNDMVARMQKLANIKISQ
jgi:hypothetical protein